MNEANVVLTGVPRSGTTLTCHLLHKLPDTVALHEPMRGREVSGIGNHRHVRQTIERFFDDQRESILGRGRATSRTINGAVPDNPFGAARSEAGLRQHIDAKGEIDVDKELSPGFMLVIKHTSLFAAMVEPLVGYFPVYALVRNPLATLASWCTVDAPPQRGHGGPNERLDPDLRAKLAALDDSLDRQICLLGWFFEQFRRHLPEQSVIRYESVVESGGRALAVVRPEANDLSEPLTSRNMNELYDHDDMVRIGERLLASEGAYWEWYPKESVVALLDELRASTGR